MTTPALTADGAAVALTEEEAKARAAAGRGNTVVDQTSRPVSAIVRANVLTRFNALLGSLLIVILIVGPVQDALFGIILVGNTLVGIVQEVRAKHTLDRLVVVGGATATVVRAEGRREVPSRDVVEGDIVEVGRGDQIVVDGVVLSSDDLEVDESLLTGESEPVAKPQGSTVLSGSWVVAGSGQHLAEVVGEASYGRRLATEGRRFVLAKSELRAGVDVILRGVTWVLVPTAVLLLVSQLALANDLSEALRVSVAGVVNMVPEGLVLLLSTALAVGIVRLGRKQVLVSELGALEGLARVDVLCVDKTGTLTDGQPELVAIEALTDGIDVEDALAGFAASDPDPNASLLAIIRARPAAPWPVTWRVAFDPHNVGPPSASARVVGRSALPTCCWTGWRRRIAKWCPWHSSGSASTCRWAGACCCSAGTRARAPRSGRTDASSPSASSRWASRYAATSCRRSRGSPSRA